MTDRRPRTLAWLFAEFLVIVIGVLVALAVDEWREGRGQARLERFYLEGLASDLEKDSADFANFARQQDRRARAAAISLRVAQDRSVDTVFVDPDTAAALSPAAALGVIGRTNHLEPTRAAYMTMTGTGGIAIIRNPDLRRRIVDYYVAVEDRLDINGLIERELEVYRRRLEDFGFTPSDRDAILAAKPLADRSLVALIRGLRVQALDAARRANELMPRAIELRRRVLSELDR